MFSPHYLRAGAVITLPEVSAALRLETSSFAIRGSQVGGMGVCMHLRHEQTEAEFALKSIRPELLGEAALHGRFADELKVWLAASACTLVVEALAVLRIDNAATIVSCWMDGGDLGIRMPQMTVATKLEVLLRTVRALRYVNEKFNVIHRDLKPQNILLDGDGRAYLADWGLARPARAIMHSLAAANQQVDFDRPDRTSAGGFVGTLLYAAPEQIRSSETTDHRADIYSMGCLMYEMETGRPPFVATSAAEIAAMHLTAKPPSVGGFLDRGMLGLSKTIATCLAKTPRDRIQTYVELEASLLKAMSSRDGNPGRCVVGTRYERPLVGQGHKAQSALIERAVATGRHGMGLVGFDELVKHYEEAQALAVLGRYADAAKLLAPYVIAEPLIALPTWYVHHTTALHYAYCLTQIDGELEKALEVFGWISAVQEPPVAYFINHSLALLKAHRYAEALGVCEKGILRFPVDDPGLIGNRTIALRGLKRLDDARKSAFHRLDVRRDAQALEEAGVVCISLAERERDFNLPLAIAAAKDAGLLLAEGLALRCNSEVLWANAIRLRRFANQGGDAAQICDLLYNSDVFGRFARELAVCEMLEMLGEGKDLTGFLAYQQKFVGRMQTPAWRTRFDATKPSVMADRLFRQIVDKKAAASPEALAVLQGCFARNDDNGYARPVDAAKALAVAGRTTEALATLTRAFGDVPTNWDAAWVMALCHLDANDEAAKSSADRLTEQFPWRAEAFDTARLIYAKLGEIGQAEKSQQRSDEVFGREMCLFDELKLYLDGLIWPTVPA
jgi:tetratricopeptide (TPR) repeat protein